MDEFKKSALGADILGSWFDDSQVEEVTTAPLKPSLQEATSSFDLLIERMTRLAAQAQSQAESARVNRRPSPKVWDWFNDSSI